MRMENCKSNMKVVAIYDWVEGRFEFYELEGSLCDLFVGIAELYCRGAYIEFVGVAEEERIRDLLVYDQEVISSRDAAKILRSLRIPFVRVEQGTGARFVDEECVEAWLKIRVKYTEVQPMCTLMDTRGLNLIERIFL